MFTIGVLYSSVFGAVTSSWRWLSIACMVWCLFWGLLLMFCPETPLHLLTKGHINTEPFWTLGFLYDSTLLIAQNQQLCVIRSEDFNFLRFLKGSAKIHFCAISHWLGSAINNQSFAILVTQHFWEFFQLSYNVRCVISII